MAAARTCDAGLYRSAAATIKPGAYSNNLCQAITIGRMYSCCGVEEINGISYKGQTAEMVIQAICRDAFGTKASPIVRKGVTGPYSEGVGLSTLFVYTCSPHDNNGNKNPTTYYDVDAGEKLTKFIRDNGFGTVVEGGEAVNKKWHPDHTVKIWVWTSNEDALRAWWAKYEPADVPAPSKPASTNGLAGVIYTQPFVPGMEPKVDQKRAR